jgi:Tfp pilus assembly protein PilF
LLFVFRLSQVKRAPAPTPGASSKIPGRRPNLGQSATLLARQGHQALTQGNEQKAHDLFNRAIELDPANAEAWLGKGLAAQEVTEKRLCFQRTLALEPDNQLAQKELKALEKIG